MCVCTFGPSSSSFISISLGQDPKADDEERPRCQGHHRSKTPLMCQTQMFLGAFERHLIWPIGARLDHVAQWPHERRTVQPIGELDTFFSLRVTTEQNNNSSSALLSPLKKNTSSTVCHVRNPVSGHLRATDGHSGSGKTTETAACSEVRVRRVFLLLAATCRRARSCSSPAALRCD